MDNIDKDFLKDIKNIDSDDKSGLIPVSDILPDKLIILPISHRPLFPGITIPITFNGSKFKKAIEKAYDENNGIFGVTLVKEENKKDFFKSELYEVGTVMKIYKIRDMPGEGTSVLAQGLQRFKKVSEAWREPEIKWKVKYHSDEKVKPQGELKAYTISIMSSLKKLLKLNPIFQEQLKMIMSQISHENPGKLIDLVSSLLNADPEKLQDVLETFSIIERCEKILILIKEEIELSEIQEDIEKQIEDKISKQQKEFFLKEQLKIIKKKLGLEKDEKASEVEKIEEKIKNLKLTDEVSKVIHQELDKLKMLPSSSPQFHVTSSYLNELTELPWGIFTEENMDIKKVRKILNEDHYGLDDVKDTILQFISTIIKRDKVAGSILCLVGPPGVGKTSVGKSIARSLNRKFFRFSLGGMRDEAEIKGHRRTYIGAMPGKIMQALKRVESSNPVIMLDEIDKVGKSFRGDPASALLEVLDPEQNKEFLDHYLDVHFDLSNILFITTANQLDTIPPPLLNRMEVIKLSGYILEEKVQIAKQYLVPKQMKHHGLKKKEVNITDKALEIMIDKYAREAGVRRLENQIKKVMRQVTLKMAEKQGKKFSISMRNVEDYLGKPIFRREELYQKNIPGVTIGLAWTSLGGKTLYIEANGIKQKSSGFKQTGQLGKVMKESAEIAFSYVRGKLTSKKKYVDFFNNNFIHLHVPEGATPKDGPSAGITMALALYSLATRKAVKKKIAMTGEITLTGKVLKIGGVKEKTIAAQKVGINDIILPANNETDFEELPNYIRKGVNVHYVDYFDDVLDIVYD